MKRKSTKRRAPVARLVEGTAPVSVRVRRVRRLCVAFGCDTVAAEIMVELMERVETLERELRCSR